MREARAESVSEEQELSDDSPLDGWHDIPIRITVVGKVQQVMPNRRSALVEVSGVQFVATFDAASSDTMVAGLEVLIDEEYASIVGPAPDSLNEDRAT